MASLAVLFAADKPIWKLDTQAQGIPKMWIDRPVESSRYSAVRLQISPDNEVIISFFQRRRQRELATKTTPEKSGSIFVSLFIDKDDGGLITKSEWPVIGESVWWERASRGSRIKSLASGGYVGIINGHLQVLDSSLKVIHDRTLDRPREHWKYDLITPLAGSFFILAQRYVKFTERIEVIDSRTFKILDQWESSDLCVQDIWEDHIVAIRSQGNNGYNVIEKRIGGSWRNVFSKMEEEYNQARFTNNGTIAEASYLKQNLVANDCWFVIDGENKSDPIIYSKRERIQNIIPAQQIPVIAIEISKMSGFRAAIDMNSQNLVVLYDMLKRRKLLETKSHEDIIGYALSPDGLSLALLTEEKLEVYAVPSIDSKKK